MAWLREDSEAPTQKNLVGLVERRRAVRVLGIGADRGQRIHRARYAAIAREAALLSAQHLTRFDEHRRRATLVVLARELEASLTDSALTVFDRLMGGVFRRAERDHQAESARRGKALDPPVRALLGMTSMSWMGCFTTKPPWPSGSITPTPAAFPTLCSACASCWGSASRLGFGIWPTAGCTSRKASPTRPR